MIGREQLAQTKETPLRQSMVNLLVALQGTYSRISQVQGAIDDDKAIDAGGGGAPRTLDVDAAGSTEPLARLIRKAEMLVQLIDGKVVDIGERL